MKTNTKFENAYKKGYEHRDNLKAMATYTVEKYCTSIVPGEKLTKEESDNIIDTMSIDMATGAEIKKNEYILTGALIGVVGTIIMLTIKNKFKKKA